MPNRNPNTKSMIESKKAESQLKKQLVLSVLKQLEILNDPISNPISKAEICRRASVSKPFLYSYPGELLTPINNAIFHQNQKLRVILQKEAFTETSKDKLVESLKRKIQILQNDNKRLRNDNAILLGKLARL